MVHCDNWSDTRMHSVTSAICSCNRLHQDMKQQDCTVDQSITKIPRRFATGSVNPIATNVSICSLNLSSGGLFYNTNTVLQI